DGGAECGCVVARLGARRPEPRGAIFGWPVAGDIGWRTHSRDRQPGGERRSVELVSRRIVCHRVGVVSEHLLNILFRGVLSLTKCPALRCSMYAGRNVDTSTQLRMHSLQFTVDPVIPMTGQTPTGFAFAGRSSSYSERGRARWYLALPFFFPL